MSLFQRVINILVALDQFLFCLVCLGNSYPSETASSAAWRLEQQGRWQGKVFRPLIDFLARLFNDPNHCRLSYEDTVAGKFLPPTLPKKDNDA